MPDLATSLPQRLSFASLRAEIIGADSAFETPFGRRLLVYCDYTASGRCLRFVERYLLSLQRHYANTHTEDDVTGRSMTRLLHEAEASIKRAVNAGPRGRIIACGTGATAAIHKLQELVGIALAPATRRRLEDVWRVAGVDWSTLRDHQPVVIVGPYEHHSNEVSWREGLASVVEVPLSADGGVCLEGLERALSDPRFRDRPKIGSFSAASNVTGMVSPVHDIARLLHRHGAMACFDFAASAPYVRIDMNPTFDPADGDPSLDAVFVSPHKFLGGPGSAGVLVFNERIYPADLPPTVGGGGTVDYVGFDGHDFTRDVEERERAGTPGVLQILKAALVFQLKDAIGADRIIEREHDLLSRAFARWGQHPRIEILGNPDPGRRIGIISFNVRTPDGTFLHPKFVTTLANDLFGIQSRAGCSCAGPYGHRLLDIDRETSERYRATIRGGFLGIKPGWVRVGFHYVMDDVEADFVISAFELIAECGHVFLPVYDFDIASGAWTHKNQPATDEPFSLASALRCHDHPAEALSASDRADLYAGYLKEARALARSLERRGRASERRLDGEAGALQYFALPEPCMTRDSRPGEHDPGPAFKPPGGR
jgi:selenocysteine lyase/cysteine desulfurase